MTALHRRLRVVVDRYLPEAATRDLVRDLVTAVADHMLDGLYVPPKARGALRAANDCIPDDGNEPAVEVTEAAMADPQTVARAMIAAGEGRARAVVELAAAVVAAGEAVATDAARAAGE